MKKFVKNCIGNVVKKASLWASNRGCLKRDDFLELFPNDVIYTNYGRIKFYSPSEILFWRSRSFFEKEPETIDWINSFDKNAVFWDIGANVGLYSLYAAKKGLNVCAFEPVSQNIHIINKNILINKLDHKIAMYPIAFAGATKLSEMFIQNLAIGDAENTFDKPVDWQNKNYEVKFKQAAIGYTIDDFLNVFGLSFPDYIKIDVDGLEYEILYGASETLGSNKLKQILVELYLEDPRYSELISYINSKGFVLDSKKRSKLFDNTVYQNVYNHIFVRN